MRPRVLGPLLGRDAEVSRLKAVLDELWAGGSAGLLVTGEPGIGKTRLLGELASRARARGGIAVMGRAAEYEFDLPFAAWVDAFDEHLVGGDPPVFGDVALSALAEALPSTGRIPGRGPPLVVDERYRVHGAMRSALSVTGCDRPLVVILDDLHWADPASVELIAALLRRPPPTRVLLALGLRARQAPERLTAAVERAERERRLERMPLQPLTFAESEALLGGRFTSATRELLFLESGGNPFYLEHLARGTENGERSSAGARMRAADVPPAVAAALAEEIRALDADAQLVLAAAAVAGAEFDADMLAAIAGVSQDVALRCLDVLVRVDLIRPAPGLGRLTMRHPLVRRAVYHSAGAGWRLAAHRRAAAALESRNAAPETFAHHVSLSARSGDEVAVSLLVEAAERVHAHAPASAARWLTDALSLLDGSRLAETRRGDILLALAAAHAADGRLDDARSTLVTAIAGTAPADVGRRVRLITACAGVEHLLGHHEEAHTRLRGALASHPEPGSTDEVRLLVALAVDAFHRSDIDGMVSWGALGARASTTRDQGALAIAGSAVVALGHALAGRTARARADRDKAAADFDALGDAELADCLDAAQFLALAEMYLERFEASAAHAQRGIRVARGFAQGHQIAGLTVSQGFCAAMLGRLSEARDLLDGAVEATRLVDNPFSLGWVLMNAGIVAVMAGDIPRGREAAIEAIEVLTHLDEDIITAYAGTLLGYAELEDGDFSAAVERIVLSGGGPDIPLIGGFWRVHTLEALTRANLGIGRVEAAVTAAAVATRIAEELELSLARSLALRARAIVRLELGAAAEAATLAVDAVGEAEAAGARLEAARARILAGRALASLRRREHARDQLRAAVVALDACGARRDAAIARAALRRMGEVARRTPSGDPQTVGLAALTQREHEIADLVWDRRTNREIAQTLFLSPKTVESHMRNIFAKARVSSRVELARQVEHARAPGDTAASGV